MGEAQRNPSLCFPRTTPENPPKDTNDRNVESENGTPRDQTFPMNVEKIGFVAGLTAELALLKGAPFLGGAGGGTPAGAANVSQLLIEKGAKALVSFGLAGGLNPGLAPGALLVPEHVVESDNAYPCDAALVAWLGGATMGAMLGGEKIAVTATEKAALFAASGADAIDLESGAVARIARAHGLPFAVLRAVADPAGRTLPPAALIALNQSGQIGFLRVLASVFRNPGQLPALLALAQDAAAARRALAGRLEALAAHTHPRSL
jgi:adenosylhomocysteine nucleosidase